MHESAELMRESALKDSMLQATSANASEMVDRQSQAGAFRRSVITVMVIGVLIRVPFLFMPLTFGSDTWRQADTASIARHFTENGFNILRPQINWGGAGPGYVESEFQLFPYIVSLLYAAVGEYLWIGRAISLMFAFGSYWVFSLLVRRILGPELGIWSLAFFLISPLSVRYSVAFMPEATAMFFYVGALYLFLVWMESQETTCLLGSAVSTAIAILVKGTPIHIGLILFLLAVYKFGWCILRRKIIWIAGTVSLLPGLLWFDYAHNLYLKYGNTFGILSGGDSKFGTMSDWLSPHFYYSLMRLDVIWIFAGLPVLLFLIGLVQSIRHRQHPIVAYGFVAIVIYYLVLGRYTQESWGIQYHIFMTVYAALGTAMGIRWIQKRLSRKSSLAVTVACTASMAIGSGALYYQMMSKEANWRGDHLIKCAKEVQEVVPEDAKIIVSSPSYAVANGRPNNFQEPTIFFYANRYGWSLPIEWHTPRQLEEYRGEGALYFVIHDQDLLDRNPKLQSYLRENAVRMERSEHAICVIYRFAKNSRPLLLK